MTKRFWIGLGLGLACAVSARGLTAEEQMRFADGIYLRGFYETAAGEYLALLRDHPDSARVPAARVTARVSRRRRRQRQERQGRLS